MTYVVVITDGLANSVAASQIIEPLKRYHATNPNIPCVLISFERTQDTHLYDQIKQQVPFATLHIYPRLPFIGMWSLRPLIRKLRPILSSLDRYHIRARGPLAGFVALKSATEACTGITIQARSLLAQEYLFAHPLGGWYQPRTWLHRVRARQLYTLEQYVYGTAAHAMPVKVQSVSHALQHYLQTTYKTPLSRLTIARDDIPAVIAVEQIIAWRLQTRTELAIPQDATVYCYNGSVKAWQCIDQVIALFAQKVAQDPNSILLILTTDLPAMQVYIEKQRIPAANYRIIHCAHQDIYRYLSAADFGMILRQPHIINWTSRPTKVLEYQAVGLPIIHNNTIAMLVDKKCCSPH